MKYKTVTIPLWDRYITIVFGGDEKSVLSLANKFKFSEKAIDDIKKDDIDNGTRAAAWWCNKLGEGMMWFKSRKIPCGLMGHEATHLVDYLLMYVGAETEMEARAHTVEWLIELIEKLKKT